MPKYSKGDMVVPIKKSIGCSLQGERHWNEAKNTKGYLVVNRVLSEKTHNGKPCYSLSQEGKIGGNHYAEDDFIPYHVDEQEAFARLVRGQINDDQYENITKTTRYNVKHKSDRQIEDEWAELFNDLGFK